jgi:hypothetical protein
LILGSSFVAAVAMQARTKPVIASSATTSGAARNGIPRGAFMADTKGHRHYRHPCTVRRRACVIGHMLGKIGRVPERGANAPKRGANASANGEP